MTNQPLSITDEQIQTLCRESAEKGDQDIADTCEKALHGDEDARTTCAGILAELMSDDSY